MNGEEKGWVPQKGPGVKGVLCSVVKLTSDVKKECTLTVQTETKFSFSFSLG